MKLVFFWEKLNPRGAMYLLRKFLSFKNEIWVVAKPVTRERSIPNGRWLAEMGTWKDWWTEGNEAKR